MLTALLALGPIALVVLWLTFHHKPSWYHPVTLDSVGAQRARRDAVSTADFVSDRMVQRKPFDVVLHDTEVTNWLAALPTIWPHADEILPPEIDQPAVSFRDGEVRVGAHYRGPSWQAVVSVGVRFDVSDDGAAIGIRLANVRGGSMPIPQSALNRLLDAARLDSLFGREVATTDEGVPIFELRTIRSVSDLFQGVRIENRFVWFNGRRPFRIASIQIQDGALRLRLEPP